LPKNVHFSNTRIFLLDCTLQLLWFLKITTLRPEMIEHFLIFYKSRLRLSRGPLLWVVSCHLWNNIVLNYGRADFSSTELILYKERPFHFEVNDPCRDKREEWLPCGPAGKRRWGTCFAWPAHCGGSSISRTWQKFRGILSNDYLYLYHTLNSKSAGQHAARCVNLSRGKESTAEPAYDDIFLIIASARPLGGNGHLSRKRPSPELVLPPTVQIFSVSPMEQKKSPSYKHVVVHAKHDSPLGGASCGSYKVSHYSWFWFNGIFFLLQISQAIWFVEVGFFYCFWILVNCLSWRWLTHN
jgi:hypothetical protein